MKPPIPEAALQQHVAILGKTGSGKTVTSKGFVEQWLTEGRHVGIVDPTSAWWGLRSSRDGKGPGFPILLLGGDHGDLPLPALGGAAVARLLAEQGVSLIADTSLLTVGERTRWFIDFGSTLHRLNRSPLHLVIDEAHMFAPQGKVPDPDTGKMLHAANMIASGGRSRGIRLTMITQRPAKLHKDTLTCADTLIAMRMLAPQDREAVEDWIKGCGDVQAGKQVLNTLASLQRGEGWAWYPEGGFLQRLKFPANSTFDSSATPTDGHTRAAPKGMADIDLTEVKAALADAVKEVEANDPKLLRAEIARLKAEAGKPRELAVDVEALAREYSRGRSDFHDAFVRELRDEVDGLLLQLHRAASTAEALRARGIFADAMVNAPAPRPRQQTPAPAAARAAPAHRGNGSAAHLPPAERAFLTVLAQQGRPLTRNQVAIFAGYSAKSRHVDNTLATLRSSEYAVGGRDAISITDKGLTALGDFNSLPTGRSLRDYWMAELPPAAAAFLRVVCEAHPNSLTRNEIAERASYSPTSRHVDNTLAMLRSRELVSGGRAAIRASDDLFGGPSP